jgi:hypothetical protein
MKKMERVRQAVSSFPGDADMKRRTEEGWKLAAIEWEREIETGQSPLSGDVPFGLQIASSGVPRLEESSTEREILFQLMELIVQEGSYARIAEEMNRRGFRTRQGSLWSPIAVFEMLPRLIEVGPQMFQSSDWQSRRQQLTQVRANHSDG